MSYSNCKSWLVITENIEDQTYRNTGSYRLESDIGCYISTNIDTNTGKFGLPVFLNTDKLKNIYFVDIWVPFEFFWDKSSMGSLVFF